MYTKKSHWDCQIVHQFCRSSCDGRVKFPIALKTIDWSTSQLSLVCERATASNENSNWLSFRMDNLRLKLLDF